MQNDGVAAYKDVFDSALIQCSDEVLEIRIENIAHPARFLIANALRSIR